MSNPNPASNPEIVYEAGNQDPLFFDDHGPDNCPGCHSSAMRAERVRVTDSYVLALAQRGAQEGDKITALNAWVMYPRGAHVQGSEADQDRVLDALPDRFVDDINDALGWMRAEGHDGDLTLGFNFEFDSGLRWKTHPHLWFAERDPAEAEATRDLDLGDIVARSLSAGRGADEQTESQPGVWSVFPRNSRGEPSNESADVVRSIRQTVWALRACGITGAFNLTAEVPAGATQATGWKIVCRNPAAESEVTSGVGIATMILNAMKIDRLP